MKIGQIMNRLLIISAIALLTLGSAKCHADDDSENVDHYKKSYDIRDEHSFKNLNNLKSDPLYIKVCGSCHMAYQPEFLPRRSWKKIMETLNKHFGTDATVEPRVNKEILAYLMDNAADRKRVGIHFTELAGSIQKRDTPLRISNTPYFIKTHSKLTQEQISQSDVKSIANCNACHKKAEQGDYRKRSIIIPNYGTWKD